jgi:hypothetical protein
MTRKDWSAPTSQGEAFARARGRRRLHALQRDRAEARRLLVRKRLPSLQAEAWRKYPKGMIPRVTVGGILYGSLARLADELGVDRATIKKDLRTIEREDLRRLELAARLPALREEAGVSRKGRLPKDMVWRLSGQFRVTPWVIRQDIRVIDTTTTYTRPPAPKRQPWEQWARLRPRPSHFTRQLTTLFSEKTYEQLIATGHPSRIIRQAVEAYLSTGTHHSTDDCAMVIAQACAPETIGRLMRVCERLNRPLIEVLAAFLLVRSKEEAVGL